MKAYISIGQLVQDLRKAYVAATKSRGLASRLMSSAKRSKCPRRIAKARQHLSRTCTLWNKIEAELNQYEDQIADAFVMTAYSGVIVGNYKNEAIK